MARPHGPPRVRRVVSREAGGALRRGSAFTGTDHPPRLRACPLAGRRGEDRARAALQLHLHPYGIDPEVDYSKETPTLVEFRLEKTATGTLLTLTESGFDKVPAGRRAEAYRMNDGGWTQQVENIDTQVANL